MLSKKSRMLVLQDFVHVTNRRGQVYAEKVFKAQLNFQFTVCNCTIFSLQ